MRQSPSPKCGERDQSIADCGNCSLRELLTAGTATSSGEQEAGTETGVRGQGWHADGNNEEGGGREECNPCTLPLLSVPAPCCPRAVAVPAVRSSRSHQTTTSSGWQAAGTETAVRGQGWHADGNNEEGGGQRGMPPLHPAPSLSSCPLQPACRCRSRRCSSRRSQFPRLPNRNVIRGAGGRN